MEETRALHADPVQHIAMVATAEADTASVASEGVASHRTASTTPPPQSLSPPQPPVVPDSDSPPLPESDPAPSVMQLDTEQDVGGPVQKTDTEIETPPYREDHDLEPTDVAAGETAVQREAVDTHAVVPRTAVSLGASPFRKLSVSSAMRLDTSSPVGGSWEREGDVATECCIGDTSPMAMPADPRTPALQPAACGAVSPGLLDADTVAKPPRDATPVTPIDDGKLFDSDPEDFDKEKHRGSPNAAEAVPVEDSHFNDNVAGIVLESVSVASEDGEETDVKLSVFTAPEEAPSCPICLEDYSDANPVAYNPCGHAFHYPCLLEWFQRSNSCPLCCLDVTPQIDESEGEHSTPNRRGRGRGRRKQRGDSSAAAGGPRFLEDGSGGDDVVEMPYHNRLTFHHARHGSLDSQGSGQFTVLFPVGAGGTSPTDMNARTRFLVESLFAARGAGAFAHDGSTSGGSASSDSIQPTFAVAGQSRGVPASSAPAVTPQPAPRPPAQQKKKKQGFFSRLFCCGCATKD